MRAIRRSPRLAFGLSEAAGRYDLLLCDVWGIIHNGVVYDRSTVEALRRFRQGGGSVVLLTNAPAPAAQVQGRLDGLEVPQDAYDAIATSGDVTVDLIVEAGCPPLFSIGPRGELALYAEAGKRGPRYPDLVGIDEAALAICIGLDETGERPEDYDRNLARLQARKTDLICANPDIVVEMGDRLDYCAGAIAERYARIGGRVIQAGKPFPAIYERALKLAGALRGETPTSRILAVGDAVHTDIAGAVRQGLDSVFVTTGIHRNALHPRGRGTPLDESRLDDLLAEHAVTPLAAVPALAWGA